LYVSDLPQQLAYDVSKDRFKNLLEEQEGLIGQVWANLEQMEKLIYRFKNTHPTLHTL
jgi:hypothetical protein